MEESISILALVCPEPQGFQQVPVIIGTNASFFGRLAAMSGDSNTPQVLHALRIQSNYPDVCLTQKLKENATEKPEAKVKWIGPHALIVPPRGEVYAGCKMEYDKPLKDTFVVEAVADDQLPAGLFITPVVLPFSAIKVDTLQLPVHNETSKEVAVPPGAVLAHMFPTDTVTKTKRESI